MKTGIFQAVLISLHAVTLLAAESPTVYLGDQFEHRIYAIAADAAGNTYATGARVFKYPPAGISPLPSERPEVFVAKLDSTNSRVWIQYVSGKDTDYGTAVATDRDGSIYVAGTTNSPNFPLRNPLQARPSGAFIFKLSPDASRVLWSTFYGGTGTKVTSLAVGPDGNLIAGGSMTADAFFSTRAFVVKIDPSGTRIIWERQFMGTQLACSGGSSCFLSPRNNSAIVAVDSRGNIYAAGNTNTLDFPTTAGAYLEKGYGPYVRKFGPDGTLLWSTYLSNNRLGITHPVSPADTLSAIAIGPDDSLHIAGGGSPGWPTTPGAYRTAYDGPAWPPQGPAGVPNPYVAKINSAGAALVYSTFVGHNGAVPVSITVDSTGAAYVSGAGDYITAVNAGGSALLFDNNYAKGARGAAVSIDLSRRIHAAGALGLITLIDNAASNSGVSGVANAAGPAVTGRIAPGELISIYGWNLGDQVFVDELPAPILYNSADQINAVMPFATGGRERVTIAVRRNGVDTARAVVAMTNANPEIFKLPDGQAAALNSDGSVNSKENPAKPGSLISIWGTGAAGWPPGTMEGSVNSTDSLIHLSIGASAGYQPSTEVTFSGAAPGLAAGVFQVNLRLPAAAGSGLSTVDVYVYSMNELSARAFVYIKP